MPSVTTYSVSMISAVSYPAIVFYSNEINEIRYCNADWLLLQESYVPN